MSIVTAIVSAYYAEKFLEGRLLNLLDQRPQPEIVVVCQEGSPEHLITMTCKDLVVFTTTGIPTVYGAWNIAIDHATGDYLTNSNCDDRLYPGALAYMASLLDRDPNARIVYPNVDITPVLDGPPTNRYEWIDGGRAELEAGCFIGPMPMWRKELHTLYGKFDDKLQVAGDYDFWLRVVTDTSHLIHCKRSVGAYLRRPDSVEHRLAGLAAWESAKVRSRNSSLRRQK